MDIILMPSDGSSRFIFPALPEKIQVKHAAKYQSFDTVTHGNIQLPRGRDCVEVSWGGQFFGSSKRNESVVQKHAYMEPTECANILKSYLTEAKVLNLIVTDSNINLDVTLSSFQVIAYGAYGNLQYEIAFREYREIKVYETSELNISVPKQTVARADTAASSETHEVRSRDTPSRTAKTKHGAASRWTEIYSANESVIEAEASKHRSGGSDHGHWIYPGTVLTLP